MDNPQAALARNIVENTHTNLFLTGRAGTGKTTFLRRLRDVSPKRMVVLAPTGIAAINAGGVTLHSFFQLPFTPYVPGANYSQQNSYKMHKSKLELIQSLDLLVIDEISMVRADLLDAVDAALCRLRHSHEPFGGVQLLLIGDLQQLAPVAKEEEWKLLKNYYETPFFFSSRALKRTDYVTVELEKVYRQSDSHFLSLLNNVREGQNLQPTLDELNRRYVPGYVPRKEDGYIRLVTHNWQAHQINSAELQQLAGKPVTYNAQVKGKFPEFSYPTESQLTLKQGAQVMFVKNDAEHRYFNGMIGEIVEIGKDGFKVRPNLDSEKIIDVAPEEWTNTRYALNEQTKEIEEVVDGTFSQYPVKLAWAITIHKSQGLTFERVMIDAAYSFAHGQTYVALSRCKTLEGIVLTSPIPPSAIIADPHVQAFNAEMRQKNIDAQQLVKMKNDYALHLLTEMFTFEKERIALSQVERLLQEFLSRTYPETAVAYSQKLHEFDLEVMGVSGRFHAQYARLLADNGGNIETPLLQERAQKGAEYFFEKIKNIRDLAFTTRLDIDNTTVAQRMKNALLDLRKQTSVHLVLLKQVADGGFHVKKYLDDKAKALLTVDGTKMAKEKAKKAAAAKEPKKMRVPNEVKNPILYYRLQQWRKQKAAESGKPAYTFLQTSAVIAIANYAPTDAKSLLRMPGIGQKIMENYGAEILQVINNFFHEKAQGKIDDGDEQQRAALSIEARKQENENSWDVSLRLYKQGHSPAEIAKMRDLTVNTITGHLARFVQTGEVKIEELVSSDHFERIRQYVAKHPYTSETTLTDLRNAIGEDITYGDLRLTLTALGYEKQ